MYYHVEGFVKSCNRHPKAVTQRAEVAKEKYKEFVDMRWTPVTLLVSSDKAGVKDVKRIHPSELN